ncbi:MAG: tRNA (adenosine(37)-N6)-threonylcarbamoyltransferase complex ATPase subunit type 1 TsaE, partial [Candidatus Eiseniibacteriota bacterium]
MSAPPGRRTGSVEETEELGESLAPSLRAGDVVALSGPLGAGKTRFVAGLARGLSAAARVRSPTYTLVNEYPGRIALAHVDLYRLEPADVESLGLDDHLEGGALVVEWGEKLPAARRADALRLDFAIVSGCERAITAAASGARGAELLAAWHAIAATTPAPSASARTGRE